MCSLQLKNHIVFYFLFLIIVIEGYKSKKGAKILPPKYELFTKNYLPNDHQITAFLEHGLSKTYLYYSTISNGSFSYTITPCSSKIVSIISYHGNTTEASTEEFVSKELTTKHLKAKIGLFEIQISSLENDSYVHIYLSTENGGPQALKFINNLKIVTKSNKKFVLRWQESLVDPQSTYYCLVTSLNRAFGSLCSAQAEVGGLVPPLRGKKFKTLEAASQTIISSWEPGTPEVIPKDIVKDVPEIVCTEKTHLPLKTPQEGQFLSLFAVNQQSNFTYPIGSTIYTRSKKNDPENKPVSLKRGKVFVNLKNYGEKITFKFKVNSKKHKVFDVYIIPCGGIVKASILFHKKILKKQNIESFGKISLPTPLISGRYYIIISALNKEELIKISGLEIYTSTSQNLASPLPKMPREARVYEYSSLTKCDSVTIGWMVVPYSKHMNYCILVREWNANSLDSYKIPNQCGLENRLKKSTDFNAKYCGSFNTQNKEEVVFKKINNLEAGKSYVIQVTARQNKGKTLSYDLLPVHTKQSCTNFY